MANVGMISGGKLEMEMGNEGAGRNHTSQSEAVEFMEVFSP